MTFSAEPAPRASSARQTTWIAGLLIVVLAALVVPPLVFLLQGSLTIAGVPGGRPLGPTRNTSAYMVGESTATSMRPLSSQLSTSPELQEATCTRKGRPPSEGTSSNRR